MCLSALLLGCGSLWSLLLNLGASMTLEEGMLCDIPGEDKKTPGSIGMLTLETATILWGSPGHVGVPANSNNTTQTCSEEALRRTPAPLSSDHNHVGDPEHKSLAEPS